jgi:hypothetical protein
MCGLAGIVDLGGGWRALNLELWARQFLGKSSLYGRGRRLTALSARRATRR